MSKRNRSLQACLLLFIVSHCSINYFKGEHAQKQFWSNFEIKKCCGYREYKVKVIKIKFTLFFLQTNYMCRKKPLVQMKELKKE